VPKLWRGLEQAALRAVYDNRPYEAYGIEFRKEEGFLSARLYDGKKIWYFDPQPVRRKMPWLNDGEEVWRDAWTFKTQKLGRWVEVDAYGGLLTQNIVGEGLGRQLLVAAMWRLEKNGLPVVMTVHDEAMTEPKWNRDPAELKALVEEIMAEPTDWSRQIKLPVGVEGWAGPRYKK
jgi:DNA polymerase